MCICSFLSTLMGSVASSRIAYLVSQFPAINHTYVLREIQQVRSTSIDVDVASISVPDRPISSMDPDEAVEARRTFYIKRQRFAFLAAHARTALFRPWRYLRALFYALSIGKGDPEKTLHWLFYFLQSIVVGEWMRKRRLSHVHTHFSSNVALLVCRVFDISMSFTVHGYGELQDPRGFLLREKVYRAQFVSVISSFARGQVMQATPREEWHKIALARLGIDPEKFPPVSAGTRRFPFVILTVGRLSPEKGQAILIYAVERLKELGRTVKVTLVGDGPLASSLRNLVADLKLTECVQFDGWSSQSRLCSIYEAADIFVLPSFTEGIPVVLMEAMSMQLPCVASRITGIPELIRDGIDGLLVPASNIDALVEAISALMDDSNLRIRLGIAARERICRDYNLEINGKAFADILVNRVFGAVAQPAESHQDFVPLPH